MDTRERSRREQDLAAYYDNEVSTRADRELPEARIAGRAAFIESLEREGHQSVLEVGRGPGCDGRAFAGAGLPYSGVDLASGSVAACRAIGLDAEVASVIDLPFADASLDAGWNMSTLLHVVKADFDRALSEVVRVLRPGAPLTIETWEHRSVGRSTGRWR